MTDENKQRKPWYRLRNIILAGIISVFILFFWVLYESWNLAIATPNIAIDYSAILHEKALKLTGNDEESSRRGWSQLQDVLEQFETICNRVVNEEWERSSETETEPIDTELDFQSFRQVILDPGETAFETEIITRCHEEGLYESLDEIRQLSPFNPPVRLSEEGLYFDSVLRALDISTRIQPLGKMLQGDMRLAAAEDNLDRSVQAFSHVMALAQSLSYQGILINHISARGLTAGAQYELKMELQEERFSTDQCRSLLEILERRPLAPMQLCIESRKFQFLDMLQQLYSDDGEGNGYLLDFPDATGLYVSFVNRFLEPTRQEYEDRYQHYIDLALQVVEAEPARRSKRIDQFEQYVVSIEDRFEIIRIEGGSLIRVLKSVTLTQLQYEEVRLLIALEIYEAEHGHPPESLEDLVPGILDELPLDPLQGESFGYRLINNDPLGRMYLLYSVGLDRVDNGGRMPLPDEYISVGGHAGAITHEDTRGFDYVINRPRNYDEWFMHDVPLETIPEYLR